MNYLRENNVTVYTIYKVMYYSGARLSEAIYLIRNIEEFRRNRLPEKDFKSIGYIDLDEAVRINVHWSRGYKRCDFLWLPKDLFEELVKTMIDRRNVSKYAERHSLLKPKYVRKLHYQILEDLIEDVSLREFMQNRYEKLRVGDTNYSKLVLRADKTYVGKILPRLKSYLS